MTNNQNQANTCLGCNLSPALYDPDGSSTEHLHRSSRRMCVATPFSFLCLLMTLSSPSPVGCILLTDPYDSTEQT